MDDLDELDPDDLAPRQRRFCEEYLIDLDGAKAARRAGYGPAGAKQEASRLLSRPHIAAYVEKLKAERARRVEVTADQVVRELALLAFSNMRDFVVIQDDGTAKVDLTDLSRDQAAAIQETTVETFGVAPVETRRVKLKLADKQTALTTLARHLGMLTDKSEVKVTASLEDLVRQSFDRE